MLSVTDSKNALFPHMTKANHDELEAFMLLFYHHHWYFEAKNRFDGSSTDLFLFLKSLLKNAKNTASVF